MIDAAGILDALQTFAARTGYFAAVNGHEPKSPPQTRDEINISFWAGRINPIQSSGLNSVSYRWEVTARIYANVETEPADSIDPALITATFAFLDSLANDFTLRELLPPGGAGARYVDFYGSDGEGLEAEPGYFAYNEVEYRAMTILIPLLLNDVSPLEA